MFLPLMLGFNYVEKIEEILLMLYDLSSKMGRVVSLEISDKQAARN